VALFLKQKERRKQKELLKTKDKQFCFGTQKKERKQRIIQNINSFSNTKNKQNGTKTKELLKTKQKQDCRSGSHLSPSFPF
jgi:hypothetical protein